MRELTLRGILLGAVLTLLFTAANAGGNAMSAHVIFECATVCIVVLFCE